MNLVKKICLPIYRFNNIRRIYFYDSITINNIDLKEKENLLFSNVTVLKNEKDFTNNCLNFLKNFETFALVCCGCSSKNKVQLKKSIWFSSIGLEMDDFLNYYTSQNEKIKKEKLEILKEIIKLECPVILKDKNTNFIESEISPKKIVNSSKRMRYYFNILENQACRSCYQKNKCKRFLQNYSGIPDFSDFSRVMIGFYNICKAYLKRNESDKQELNHFIEKIPYFHFVLFYIYNYLLKYKQFNYNNLEEGNRTLILKYLKEQRKKKNLIKTQLKQEKILNIPRGYSNLIIPTAKAKMKKKQKNIFEKLQKFKKKSPILENEKFIWVEEDDDLNENNHEKKEIKDDNDYYKNNLNNDTNLIEIEDIDNSLPQFRFEYVSNKNEENQEFNNKCSIYNKFYDIYSKNLQKNIYIDLDDQNIDENIVKCENTIFHIPEQIGGYTFINYIENIPNNYIFPINENFYKGVEVYKREEINIDRLWKEIENEKLNIKKIGFYNPFNIKNHIEYKVNKNNECDDITEINDDITTFQDFLYSKNSEKKKKIQNTKKIHSNIDYNSNEIEDDEDKRFEYFKKLRKENLNSNDLNELKEQLNINDNYTNNEEAINYKHTYYIRRKLHDNEDNMNNRLFNDINEEKKNLIEDDKKELKENFYYICKNVKFPDLQNKKYILEKKQSNNINKNEYIKSELKKYLKPKNMKKNKLK